MRNVLPIITVVIGIVLIWYVAAIPMNIAQSLSLAEKDGIVV